MYIDTKSRGLIYEPANPVNRPLFDFLSKYQSTLDGSRLYDDLIDIYLTQEFDLKNEMAQSKMEELKC
ncbi:hypothetical protein C0966_00570 [Bacillus methanolicus]|uniref:hypothetical protein n=1 Tax=Bacillus methanolicus TaxID=1471 RepID=UPI002380AC51|nr:hypothetical protein [Bacillus methanolicus]MDE3837902.1 hypothetical protein [Bacillus methanolicus]